MACNGRPCPRARQPISRPRLLSGRRTRLARAFPSRPRLSRPRTPISTTSPPKAHRRRRAPSGRAAAWPGRAGFDAPPGRPPGHPVATSPAALHACLSGFW